MTVVVVLAILLVGYLFWTGIRERAQWAWAISGFVLASSAFVAAVFYLVH